MDVNDLKLGSDYSLYLKIHSKGVLEVDEI